MIAKNIQRKLFLLPILIILLSSCASLPTTGRIPVTGEYITASWYGEDFHGRPTSSGERFDMYGRTCAHKELKFGTQLRVTNPDNNRSVDVVVNDRGPFIWGRDLDLSYGAAREIGLVEKGVGTVRIEYLGRDMRYAKRVPFEPVSSSSGVTIQVGAFTEQSNALRLKQGLELSYGNVYITQVWLESRLFYRVRVGRFSSYDSAYSLAEKLAEEGYATLIMSYN